MITLVVEDDPNIMALWDRFLTPVSREIRHAASLKEGFTQMGRRPPPDLVMLDLRLPDSPEAKETLSQVPVFRKACPNAVIMIITGAVEDQLPGLAKQLGADGFYQKQDMIGQIKLLQSVKEACASQSTEERLSMIDKLTAFMSQLSLSPV